MVVNETPEVLAYHDPPKDRRAWTSLDEEFYAFTKQLGSAEGVTAYGCDPVGRRFYLKATKEGRKALSRRLNHNTWHCADGSTFRIEVLPC